MTFAGEPNNSGNEDCVHMWKSRGKFIWNDLKCHPRLPYICEKAGKTDSLYIFMYWNEVLSL